MTKFTALILIGFVAAACTPEKKSETKAETNSAAAVQEMKTNDGSNFATSIKGQIVFTNPTFDPSTGTQNVQLFRNSKVVSQASTNPDGTFEFKGRFEMGAYEVKVKSKTLIGSAPLKIERTEVKDFELPATLTSPK